MEARIRKLNELKPRPERPHVLYWMRYNRRAESNHALHFAAETANRLELPIVVFESLDSRRPYANDRSHTFVLEGMADTRTRLQQLGIGYLFQLQAGGAPASHRVFREAAAIVTDDYPETLSGPPAKFDVEAYAVDSSCVVPMNSIPQRAYAAYSLRPKIHKLLPPFLKPVPPVKVRHRSDLFEGPGESIAERVSSCEIDHNVAPSTSFRGGRAQAERCLERFLSHRLHRYSKDKNEPSAHATSDLSPYLHAGYISALEVALAVKEHAAKHKLMAEEFLEELLVRRELAFNFARYAKRVDSLEELPDWARATLEKHRDDRRDPVYSVAQFEQADTYDDLWNAAQKELLLRGKIHGYYRMYWGKKIIEWSATPEEALATMIHLHDRYALDGQDPNTYGNILWCFGLHDRPWTERPIFGSVRWMSRGGMDRKTDVPSYLREIEYLERTGKELTT